MVAVPELLYVHLLDYLRKHHDVRDGSDGPRPNEAMHLTTELEQLKLAKPTAERERCAQLCAEEASRWGQVEADGRLSDIALGAMGAAANCCALILLQKP
jgi:hypothetical protein